MFQQQAVVVRRSAFRCRRAWRILRRMETDFIAWLKQRLPADRHDTIGIGDDCAVLGSGLVRGPQLVTVDLLTEGVDFLLADVDPRRIGRKALAVNLSDIAAMAGQPTAAVVSLALPRRGASDLARALYEGIVPLAEQYEVAIVGGDTNTWDGPLAISITLLGQITHGRPVLRSGALPGDAIVVTGRFGGSILGHQFDFDPRVREAQLLHERYTLRAAIDVSDGLSLDLARLCTASQCGAEVDVSKIPVANAARQLAENSGDGRTAIDHALSDGEDFELILAVPAEVAVHLLVDQPLPIPVTQIGRFVERPGLWTATGDRLEARGYEH